MFNFLVRDFRDLQKLQRTPCKMCRNTGFFELRGNARQRNPYSGIFYAVKIIDIALFLQKLLTRKLPKNPNFALLGLHKYVQKK